MTSKESRIVNGNGYVNHCEQALDDKNEVVMASSKISVTSEADQSVSAVKNSIHENGVNNDPLMEVTRMNVILMQKLNEILAEKIKDNEQLKKKVQSLTLQLDQAHHEIAETAARDKAHHEIAERAARDKALDVLPFTPVSSTCSSGMGDLSSAELHEQQDVKSKRPKRNLQVTIKQPNSDPSEPNQVKRQITRSRSRSARAKSDVLGEMQELSLITVDNAYYTCLGDYNPVKDDPVPKNSNSNLETPSWRIKTYTSWYSMEGTENMSDDVFVNRHSALEHNERKRKKWDLQNIRDARRVEYLKARRNKRHSQKSAESDKKEITTLLPNPTNIKAIEITDQLPVSAFGCNLHIKKDEPLFTYFCSEYCHNGSKESLNPNIRGLRSSHRTQYYDSR